MIEKMIFLKTFPSIHKCVGVSGTLTHHHWTTINHHWRVWGVIALRTLYVKICSAKNLQKRVLRDELQQFCVCKLLWTSKGRRVPFKTVHGQCRITHLVTHTECPTEIRKYNRFCYWDLSNPNGHTLYITRNVHPVRAHRRPWDVLFENSSIDYAKPPLVLYPQFFCFIFIAVHIIYVVTVYIVAVSKSVRLMLRDKWTRYPPLVSA